MKYLPLICITATLGLTACQTPDQYFSSAEPTTYYMNDPSDPVTVKSRAQQSSLEKAQEKAGDISTKAVTTTTTPAVTPVQPTKGTKSVQSGPAVPNMAPAVSQ